MNLEFSVQDERWRLDNLRLGIYLTKRRGLLGWILNPVCHWILHLIKRITLERSETYRSMEQEKQYSLADVKLRMIVMRKMGTAPLELLTPSGATELSYITRTRNLRPEHNLLTIISQRSTSS